MVHVVVFSFFFRISGPGADVPLVDDLVEGDVLFQEFIPGFPAPELVVSLCPLMLEVHSIITELARHEVRRKVDLCDELRLGFDVIEGPDVQDFFTLLADFEEVLPPGIRVVVVSLERTGVVELVGRDDVGALQLLDLVKLGEVADTGGVRLIVAFNHLGNDCVDQVLLIIIAFLVGATEGINAILHSVFEEVPGV